MEYILWMRGLKYVVLGDCESNLIQTITLAPTKTGIFVDIYGTLPAAQMKELEKQFKAKYNVK